MFPQLLRVERSKVRLITVVDLCIHNNTSVNVIIFAFLSASVLESHDDDFVPEDLKHPFIRRGSISSAYDVMPEELGR